MTREDRLFIRGMDHAEKGVPPDPYEDPLYHEGYDIWMTVIRQRRLRKALANIKLPPPPRRH